MDKFTEQLKEQARAARCDLLGIAPIERFDGLPPERHPASIFPETRCVIVVGKRITRGSLRGVEEGTQFATYNLYGYEWVEDRFLSTTSIKLAEFLEDNRDSNYCSHIDNRRCFAGRVRAPGCAGRYSCRGPDAMDT